MSNVLYWASGLSNAVLTEPGHALPIPPAHRWLTVWKEHAEWLIPYCKGSWVMLGHRCLSLPLQLPSHHQQLDLSQSWERGMPGPSAQKAGFKRAACSCLKWGRGLCAKPYQGQLCGRRESSVLLSGEGWAVPWSQLALSLRPRELVVKAVRFSQLRLEGNTGRPGVAAGPAGCPLHPSHGSPIPLSWLSVGEYQEPEDILLSGGGKHLAGPHLDASGVPHRG